MGPVSEDEIVRSLKKENFSDNMEVRKFPPLGQALWALRTVKDIANVNKINAKTISYILLHIKEIDLNEKAVTKALARAGSRVHVTKLPLIPYYEIMADGRDYLDGLSCSCKPIGRVLFCSGKNAWTDPNKNFPKIVSMLEGDLRIVDRYYGFGSLDILEKIGKDRKVRFLTCELGSKEQKDHARFDISLKQFTSEFTDIEIRIYPNKKEMHDRYIIADNAFVVVGHGIKDIGGKESFVIFLPLEEVKDFLPDLKELFEERWKNSGKIV